MFQCYKHNILILGTVIDGTGVGGILNEWLTAAYWAFVRTDISRTEHHVEN